MVCLGASQVVKKLTWGLAMEGSRNMFALFEHNDSVDKAIEGRAVVADVLAKFEKYVSSTLSALIHNNIYILQTLLFSFVSLSFCQKKDKQQYFAVGTVHCRYMFIEPSPKQ